MLTLPIIALTLTAGAALSLARDVKNRWLPKPQTKELEKTDRGLRKKHSSDGTPDRKPVSAEEGESVLAKSTAVAGFGLASGLAGLINPLFLLPAVFISGYLTIPLLRHAIIQYQSKKHLIDLIDAVIFPVLILTHQIIAVSLLLFLICFRWHALAKSYDKSRQQLTSVFGSLPKSVWIIVDGNEIEVDYRTVKVGDIAVVGSGETVPVDGVVIQGGGMVDQHQLTGESVPVEKKAGDPMLATTLVVGGRFHVRVERSGRSTHAGTIADLILNTSDRRTQVQERGQAIAERSLPFILPLAAIAGLMGGVTRAIAIYLVTPGYTMRFLAPLALLRALRQAAGKGVFIKDGRSLELLKDVDMIVFDKTGTLTDGSLRVAEVIPAPGFDEQTILTGAAAAEGRQHHPIAEAIREAAAHLTIPEAEHSEYTMGGGIQARVKKNQILIGSITFIAAQEIVVTDALKGRMAELNDAGIMCVAVAIDRRLAGIIALEQTIRAEAPAVVADLHGRGLETVIISGDSCETTRHIAAMCGIHTFYAETLPAEKAALIKEMQDAGRTICYIGDGINDTAALKQAHVSLSISGSATIAVDTAQIVLLKPDISLISKLLDVSKNYEGSTRFASQLTIGLPIAGLPIVFLGYGGIIFIVAISQIGFWTGLWRILSTKADASTPGDGHVIEKKCVDNIVVEKPVDDF